MDCRINEWERAPLRFRDMQARYILSDGTSGELTIKNITHRGMGCECGDDPIVGGQEISIDLPFLGIRTGDVRWSKDGNCGIEMHQPLDVDCLKLYSNLGELPNFPDFPDVASDIGDTSQHL